MRDSRTGMDDDRTPGVHDADTTLVDVRARVLDWLRDGGVAGGADLAVAIATGAGIGLATATTRRAWPADDPAAVVAAIEATVGPRWIWWDRATTDVLAARGVHVVRCWDVVTAHRFLYGGWRTTSGVAWAVATGATGDLPTMGQLDLLAATADEGGDPGHPVRPDGHLRPEWTSGGWAASAERLASWAGLALVAAEHQRDALAALPDPARARSTVHAESAAEALCAELSHDGLPLDAEVATSIVAAVIGPRPTGPQAADLARTERDAAVTDLLGSGGPVDLRSPNQVKAMLRRVGVDVPDTRAWRLETLRDAHPVVGALLEWRKAERMATTYGYRWLDEHVRDGRLRGEWTSCDGAAGRMTATAGLHSLPSELRPAVAAEPGHLLVRADLGQIEPRVLAAVSGDRALVAATADDDLYQPVADRLRVGRDVAKVAVLGAMYGGTTGESAHALRRLEQSYPAAMEYLEAAAAAGRAGDDVVTIGGRRVRMWVDDDVEGDLDRAYRAAAARGRFARNAVVQGAAAELFKVWAVIVRTRGRDIGARIVLCLHDELLVHAPTDVAGDAAALVLDALGEAAYRWSPEPDVRFVADVSVIERWSQAKS